MLAQLSSSSVKQVGKFSGFWLSCDSQISSYHSYLTRLERSGHSDHGAVSSLLTQPQHLRQHKILKFIITRRENTDIICLLFSERDKFSRDEERSDSPDLAQGEAPGDAGADDCGDHLQ